MHGDHGGAPAAGVDLGTDARPSPVPTAAPRGAHRDTRASGSPARGVLVRVAPWALTATTVVAGGESGTSSGSGSSGTATTSLPPPATVVPGSATTAPGP